MPVAGTGIGAGRGERGAVGIQGSIDGKASAGRKFN